MYIKSLNINSFGKMENCSFDFDKGINVVYGENEAGKSTLSAFIKYMLYGFSGLKKHSPEENEKMHYVSWNTGIAGGTLTISNDWNEYTVRRFFNGKAEECSVTDNSTGKEVICPDGIGEYFLKMNSSAFVATAQTMQSDGCKTGGAEVAVQIQNMLFSADEDVNIKNAQSALDKERTLLRHKVGNGGKLYELEVRKNELESEFEEAKINNSKFITVSSELDKWQVELAKAKKGLEKAEKEYSDFKQYEKIKRLDELENARKKRSEAETDLKEKEVCLPEGLKEYEIISLYTSYSNALNFAENQKKQYDEKKEELNNFGATEYSELETDVEIFNKSKYSSLLLPIIFAILSAASAAIAAFTVSYIYILTAVFFVLFCSFLIVFIKNKKFKKNITKKYNKYENNFEIWAKETLANKSEYDKLKVSVDALKISSDNAESLAQIELTKLSELIGKTIFDFADAQKTVNEIQNKFAEYNKCKMDFDNCDYSLKAIEDSVDEAELINIKNTVPKPTKDENTISFELNKYKNAFDIATKTVFDKKNELAVLKATSQSPYDVYSKLSEINDELERETLRFKAIELAENVLDEAGKKLKSSIAPKITQTAHELLERTTNGKYKDIITDKEFNISVNINNDIHSLAYFSSGTQDLLYLAFRYGLLKLICDEEQPPLMIFDDAFARIDAKRLIGIMEIITEISLNTQIIIFTCHKRESKILSVAKKQYNEIIL